MTDYFDGNTKNIVDKVISTGKGICRNEIFSAYFVAEHTRVCYNFPMYKNRTPTHVSWESMKTRCNGKSDPSYPRYGGKGIKVCKRWKSFDNFLFDMGERPTGMSLDRINNKGNYTPKNCKWSSKTEQQRNKNNNRLVTFKNKTQTLAAWIEELKINKATLTSRINKYKWTVERAFTENVRDRQTHK